VSVAVVHRVSIYPLSIPLRSRITHAASRRSTADPVVVAVELTNGIIGYGETLPRSYVTGETVESVIRSIQSTFGAALIGFHAESFPEALELIEALPWNDDKERPVAAARTAVELALLDATLRAFRRDMDAVVQWMGLPGFGSPGSLRHIRFSGVVASDVATSLRQLRLMYWGGLRHFKLKVGTPGDREHLELVCAYLRRPLAKGRVTLRIDANGAWTKDSASEWLSATAHLPYFAVEQPLPRGREDDLSELPVSIADASSRRLKPAARILVHDESLVTIDDAQHLIELGVADAFNIRISKCGGLIPSLRLAALARRHEVGIQLGCMVGETSILSAAGLRFLEVCPGVEWAEGCFGSFLLSADVAKKQLRFGYGGRPPTLRGPGLGVTVDPACLVELCEAAPVVINL